MERKTALLVAALVMLTLAFGGIIADNEPSAENPSASFSDAAGLNDNNNLIYPIWLNGRLGPGRLRLLTAGIAA